MRPTAFVHAGGPKTGSTSIQSFIRSDEAWFRENGIYIPNTGRLETGARHHHALNHSLAAGPYQRSRTSASLHEELNVQGCPNVLISAESIPNTLVKQVRLMNLRAGQTEHSPISIVKVFQDLGYDVRFILYVRNTPELLNSSYTQEVKALRVKGKFERWATQYLEEIVSWLKIWPQVEEMDGVSFVARPFNSTTKKNGVIRDFVSCLGLQPPDEEPPRANESLGPIYVQASKIAKRRLGLIDHDDYETKIRIVRRGIKIRYLRSKIDESQYCGLTEERVAFFNRQSHDVAEEFSQRYWKKPWRDVFASDFERSYTTNDLDDFAEDIDRHDLARKVARGGMRWARAKLANASERQRKSAEMESAVPAEDAG